MFGDLLAVAVPLFLSCAAAIPHSSSSCRSAWCRWMSRQFTHPTPPWRANAEDEWAHGVFLSFALGSSFLLSASHQAIASVSGAGSEWAEAKDGEAENMQLES